MKKVIFSVIIVAMLFASVAFANNDTLWTRNYGTSNGVEYFYDGYVLDDGIIACGYTNSYGAGSYDGYLVKTDFNGSIQWFETVGTSGQDRIRDFDMTSDGGYILVGDTWNSPDANNAAWKVDSLGNLEWWQSYNQAGTCILYAVEPTADGGYVMIGYHDYIGHSGWLMKTNASGSQQWSHRYVVGSHGDAMNFKDIIEIPGEGYAITGSTNYQTSGGNDMFLLVYDQNGNVEWVEKYGGAENDGGNCILRTDDNGYLLLGYTASEGAGGNDVWLVKVDHFGYKLWERTYGTSSDENAYHMEELDNGDYLISARTNGMGAGGHDAWLIRIDASGNELWSSAYGQTNNEYAGWASETPDGSYVMVGYSDSYTSNYDGWIAMTGPQQATPCCDIDMVPDEFPITVQPGGSFGMTGIIGNPNDTTITTQVWVGVETPMGGFIELYQFLGLPPLAPGMYPSAHLNQFVPSSAQPGTYYMKAFCGDYANWIVCDTVSFPFEVAGSALDGGATGWALEGGWDEDFTQVPSSYELHSNYPNPFNAETNITFDIAESGNVSVKVYNLAGQLMETLVEGYMEAGHHSVNWDASTYSSGVYFYSLTAGEFNQVKKMTLIK